MHRYIGSYLKLLLCVIEPLNDMRGFVLSDTFTYVVLHMIEAHKYKHPQGELQVSECAQINSVVGGILSKPPLILSLPSAQP